MHTKVNLQATQESEKFVAGGCRLKRFTQLLLCVCRPAHNSRALPQHADWSIPGHSCAGTPVRVPAQVYLHR
jgi:hypothetical protein